MAFSSSFGQTFFIGVFGPGFQREFGLGHTAWGGLYMAGTLASALLLPWTGRLIDRVDLRVYAFSASFGLALACVLVATVAGPVVLCIAVFALRHTGQGLSSHVAQTSMARYFEGERGRAIAVTALGFAAGEAVLPLLAVTGIEAFGWRRTYLLAAVVQCLAFIPLMQWLLRGHADRHKDYVERLVARARATLGGSSGWSRAEVLRDRRFYLLLPGVFAPSVVLTAMFFHHLNVADAKGWSHAWITGNYVVYASVTVVTSLLAGPLIDRLGALRLVPLMLGPLVVGLVILAVFPSPWIVVPYMICCGLTTGITYTAVSALWAELYGVAHLGAIRALAFAVGVFGSALGPVMVGGLLDAGLSMAAVLLVMAGYVVAGAIMLAMAVRLPRREVGA